MKQGIVILIIALFIAIGCNQTTTRFKSENFSADEITYVKDQRTGLCFAIVAGRTTGDLDQTGLGFTCVPCEKVQNFLGK